MTEQNYTTSFTVDQTPEEVFAALANPRAWWSEDIDGETDKLGAIFYYHFKDIHRGTFKVSELVPGRKVVWHVLQNYFNFVKDTTEWTGTDIVFEIAPADGATVAAAPVEHETAAALTSRYIGTQEEMARGHRSSLDEERTRRRRRHMS